MEELYNGLKNDSVEKQKKRDLFWMNVFKENPDSKERIEDLKMQLENLKKKRDILEVRRMTLRRKYGESSLLRADFQIEEKKLEPFIQGWTKKLSLLEDERRSLLILGTTLLGEKKISYEMYIDKLSEFDNEFYLGLFSLPENEDDNGIEESEEVPF